MTDPAVAIVTGASRGIGAILAEALHERGWVVERGSSALVDVTDEAAVNAWVREILQRRGRIDLLVNNAGVIDHEVPLEESEPTNWWRTVEVNVRGPYLLTRAVLPHLIEQGSGRVVNLNSGSGTKPGRVASAYNVSKTALARLTESTHLSGVGRGVFAFDFAPGVVRTDMTSAMALHAQRVEWTSPTEVIDLFVALADGDLDAWSGRMVRAGTDTAADLHGAAPRSDSDVRTVRLRAYGPTDPLG